MNLSWTLKTYGAVCVKTWAGEPAYDVELDHMSIINIYCDESCHLPNDSQPVMVLGAVICPKDHARDVAVSLRQLRVRHGLSQRLEIK